MNITNTLFILGAPDPEMETIERMARNSGASVAHAATGSPTPKDHPSWTPGHTTWTRVHSGNAYRASGTVSGPYHDLSSYNKIILVECDLPGWFSGDSGNPGQPQPEVVRIDHHHPGDPGYGRPPEEFWQASSIGQTARLLSAAIEFFPTPDELHVAAADHCLEAAYRGRCPGVTPESLMRWRAETRAAFQRRPVESLLADIEAARGLLRGAPRVFLGHGLAPDPCEAGTCPVCGDGTSSPNDVGEPITVADMRGPFIPELPEAAAREGIAFLTTMRDRDGRSKVVLQSASPEAVRAFLERWAPTNGIVDTYGDPARGFAGGYITQ